ncbi:hypothetical protein N658DRAFT_105884 [Parathielavia hyrcaniae]|uniref:Uncharacterized protein n=1 Tax=Parathielavia hyrcaniae TaxID=113614 RepID=A0AAN6Q3G1_9PEZI|nr:hypothetical protein N658DRAFT_105884 [Parathielavia hyrcaniae]
MPSGISGRQGPQTLNGVRACGQGRETHREQRTIERIERMDERQTHGIAALVFRGLRMDCPGLGSGTQKMPGDGPSQQTTDRGEIMSWKKTGRTDSLMRQPIQKRVWVGIDSALLLCRFARRRRVTATSEEGFACRENATRARRRLQRAGKSGAPKS